MTAQTKMLSPSEVAGRLNASKSTVYQWIRTNRLPHYKAGKLVRISEEQLAAFLEAESKRKSAPEKDGNGLTSDELEVLRRLLKKAKGE